MDRDDGERRSAFGGATTITNDESTDSVGSGGGGGGGWAVWVWVWIWCWIKYGARR